MNKLLESFVNCPIIMKEDYPYFIHSLTDGAIPIKPDLLLEASERIVDNILHDCDQNNIDLILAPEAMSLPISTIVSTILNIPFVVIRKRQYYLPNELPIQQQTGYSKNTMYINSVKPKDNVIIIDDIISTGGTLKAIMDSLRLNYVNVLGSYVIVEKSHITKKLYNQGYNICSILNIEMDKRGISEVSWT